MRIGALVAALIVALLSAPPAVAIDPPTIDAAVVPPDEMGPDQPTEQRRVCSAPTAFPNSNFADKPWANDYLRMSDAQKFATGAGVTVAVIDTGVTGSPRVPAEPGGDFVDKAGNGMSDCDSHGTLTASIIAGRPAPTDGFIGVAPDARILSLRQTSEAFQPVGSRNGSERPEHHPDRGFAAQPGPCRRACGQHRRAGDQHQRGRLLQGDQAHQRIWPWRGHQLRGQRQGRGHHRRGGQHRPGLHAEPAPGSGHSRRSPRLEAGADRSSARRGTRHWC